MNQKDLKAVAELLAHPKKITVTSHYNPDGDAVGSALAMYHLLKNAGHEVKVVIPNDMPDFLRWIPGSGQIVIHEKQKEAAEKELADAEVIFCLDYNAPSRVKDMQQALVSANGVKILIDHHPHPDVASFNYIHSFTDVSSTAELVFGFVEKIGYRQLIDKPAAEALYAGIVTDTGSFSYGCNHASTYLTVAELIETGIDVQRLHRLIYDTFTENRIRLLGNALSEKMIILPGLHTALIPLTKADLEKYGYQPGDTEGLVNHPLSIRTVNLSVMLTERDDLIRLSFRSKGDFPANRIAREHFEGGGHLNAAGGDSYLPMDQTIEKLKQVLSGYRDLLDFEIQ